MTASLEPDSLWDGRSPVPGNLGPTTNVDGKYRICWPMIIERSIFHTNSGGNYAERGFNQSPPFLCLDSDESWIHANCITTSLDFQVARRIAKSLHDKFYRVTPLVAGGLANDEENLTGSMTAKERTPDIIGTVWYRLSSGLHGSFDRFQRLSISMRATNNTILSVRKTDPGILPLSSEQGGGSAKSVM